jgi:hypothetical protein
MGQRQQGLDLQRSSSDAVLQRQSIEKLHHDEAFPVLLADFVDGADVGMVEGGSSTGFATETFQRLWVLRDIVGEKFKRDKATKRGVLRSVDDTHAPAAEFLDDAVVRDNLVDHLKDAVMRVASS